MLRELGLSISENMDNKNFWKEENMDLTWKSLQKDIGLENPTPLMNQVFLGCTQKEATVDDQAVQSKTEWFKKLTTIREVDVEDQTKETESLQKITAWSNDMASHAEKRVAIYCEFAKQHVFFLQQVATPCIDDHLIPPEDNETTGKLSAVCAQSVQWWFYQAKIVRPDLLSSVSILARSVTKWNKACGKKWSRLIKYINQTKNCWQFCHVESQIEDCKLSLFQDASFTGGLRDSKSTSGDLQSAFGSHTFVPIFWIDKRHTAVSHSSAESEIISLDEGLRIDGLPALQF